MMNNLFDQIQLNRSEIFSNGNPVWFKDFYNKIYERYEHDHYWKIYKIMCSMRTELQSIDIEVIDTTYRERKTIKIMDLTLPKRRHRKVVKQPLVFQQPIPPGTPTQFDDFTF